MERLERMSCSSIIFSMWALVTLALWALTSTQLCLICIEQRERERERERYGRKLGVVLSIDIL
jgi:hypothetical protein